MKSGMQMMLEGMLGADGVKAVEDCKRILPAVPQLIESIKTEWNSLRQQINDYQVLKDVDGEQREDILCEIREQRTMLEFILDQQKLIVSKLENLEFKVDLNKVTETPPTLMHHLSVPENAERFVTDGVNSNGNNHD